MEATGADDPRINTTVEAAKGLMAVIGCATGAFEKCVESVALNRPGIAGDSIP
jgi:hypothetical protein